MTTRRSNSNEGGTRFGIVPQTGTMDTDTIRPSLKLAREAMGWGESFIHDAQSSSEKADEYGRQFLVSDPQKSEVQQLGNAKMACQDACRNLASALAYYTKAEQAIDGILTNLASGKDVDLGIEVGETIESRSGNTVAAK